MRGVGLNFYNIFGVINTLFIIVSLYGVHSQLRTIWKRKESNTQYERPTSLLSLNQFTVSYLAYLSFFIYGYSIEPFNHYIVWPRLIASMLVVLILLEIWQDRRSSHAKSSVSMACITLLVAIAGLFIGETITDQGKYISTTIIVVVSILIAQGYFHQIKLIIHSGSTGAVDLKMSQFILMMDISTIAFALSMGFKQGWPLLLLAITSAVTKVIIMFLFKWVKTSPTAEKRRRIVET
ncbi:hypothetical protein DXX92_12425 [Thalassotalea euphylliae]|uniref:PQ-loop repeat-containing protein n=2 Tax=Thalassotalea euphylliae TaxID=1655234 RepID=A0A3E0UGC1_9GAMM|nr:hypothetical protein DXX92_12425 [Thalassotalea euphylliae]